VCLWVLLVGSAITVAQRFAAVRSGSRGMRLPGQGPEQSADDPAGPPAP
jgi:phosphatidylinositol phosphate synthase